MAKLLEAGFDIRKASSVLLDTRISKAQMALVENIRTGLDRGNSIANSFGADPQVITKLEHSMVDAGERGGKLGAAFQHLAEYFLMCSTARRDLIKGLIYPVVVLHMGIFVSSLPQVAISGDASEDQFFPSFLKALLVSYLIGFFLFMVGKIIFRQATKSPAADRFLNMIPWYGKARQNMALARFAQVYHSCLLAGIPMYETVQRATAATRSGIFENAGKRLLRVATEGIALGPAFLRESCFPSEFSRSYTTGEEAGTLDRDMANWAQRFTQQSEASLRAASTYLPKLIYLFALGFIVWKILGFFSTYYSQLESITSQSQIHCPEQYDI